MKNYVFQPASFVLAHENLECAKKLRKNGDKNEIIYKGPLRVTGDFGFSP